MPAGMKPLEKFLKKQTSALSRAGGFGEKGPAGSRRRSSVSRVLPFLRDLSPESGAPREIFSPEAEEPPCWPPAAADTRSPSLSSDEQSSEGCVEPPWAPLPPDTPENVMLALLDSVAGSRRQGGGGGSGGSGGVGGGGSSGGGGGGGSSSGVSSAEILLDDVMLTHPIFLPADKFQQVLLQQYPSQNVSANITVEREANGWGAWDSSDRKRAVLSVTFRYLDMYRELLQEEGERSRAFPKELYVLAAQELSRYPELVEEVLKLQRWSEIMEEQVVEDSDSKKRQVRPLFRHFRRIDACLQPREAFRGSDEIFCRVYTPDHSYVTIRSRLSSTVEEILAQVAEKLQFSEEQDSQHGALVLVAVTSSGEKIMFRPSDDSVFTTLGVNTHLFACEPAELDTLLPLPEEGYWTPGDSKLHDMSAEEVAVQLVAFDWELFSCVHEVEFIRYVFRGEEARWRPLNLELVLQRCSEVQHWVCTEILQCQSLPKRIQLLRKFVKIAALCKQHQDLLTFFSVVLGLGNPAISRLRLTWEGLPGKFKKQFQQFESIVDPSRNHKAYRDLLSSLRPPAIPFTPLLLKDLTFLHESSKTFHDGLVNFEKMHKVAEMVRTIRRYRSVQPNLDSESSPSHLQTKAYVRQLQVIDNQNLLFTMSCKLEPKDA
ncbi:RPGFL factor, partial [Polypterus senegalus]